MHEMALAQNILDIVVSTAKHNGADKILRVSIKAGELRGIIPEQLQFCFGFIAKETIAEGAELIVRTIPIRARCKGCQGEFIVKEFKFVCPYCNRTELETLHGLELMVENIEVA